MRQRAEGRHDGEREAEGGADVLVPARGDVKVLAAEEDALRPEDGAEEVVRFAVAVEDDDVLRDWRVGDALRRASGGVHQQQHQAGVDELGGREAGHRRAVHLGQRLVAREDDELADDKGDGGVEDDDDD